MSPERANNNLRQNFESGSKKIADIVIPPVIPPHNFATPSNYRSQSKSINNSPFKNYPTEGIKNENEIKYDRLLHEHRVLEDKYRNLM